MRREHEKEFSKAELASITSRLPQRFVEELLEAAHDRGGGGVPRCAGFKRDGGRCTLPARSDNGFCWAHDPVNAEARRKAASKAGRSKPGIELHEVKRTLRELADDVLEGKRGRADASVAAQILGVFLRAIEQERRVKEAEELEARLSALEELQAKEKQRYG